MLCLQMPAGALFLDDVPHDVRDFIMRVLTHALPIAVDASQDAEVHALVGVLMRHQRCK